MSKSLISEDRENRFIETIRRMEREIAQMKSSQATTVMIGTAASQTFPVAANSTTWGTATATPDGDWRLDITPEISIYKTDTSTGSNRLPGGVNWTDAQRYGVRWNWWLDRGSSDGKNIKFMFQIWNETASSIDFMVAFRVRFQASTTSGGLS